MTWAQFTNLYEIQNPLWNLSTSRWDITCNSLFFIDTIIQYGALWTTTLRLTNLYVHLIGVIATTPLNTTSEYTGISGRHTTTLYQKHRETGIHVQFLREIIAYESAHLGADCHKLRTILRGNLLNINIVAAWSYISLSGNWRRVRVGRTDGKKTFFEPAQ